MFNLSNSAVILLEALLNKRGAQEFGSWFQDAVASALGTMDSYRKHYINKGAGQPDITIMDEKTGFSTGFEVKSTSEGFVVLDGNYQAIRQIFQDRHFKLVGLRTDVKPYPLWVIEMPKDPPTRVTFKRIMDSITPIDQALNQELAFRLSNVLVAAGTSWSEANDRNSACAALQRAVDMMVE